MSTATLNPEQAALTVIAAVTKVLAQTVGQPMRDKHLWERMERRCRGGACRKVEA